jgi:hypothetical protein
MSHVLGYMTVRGVHIYRAASYCNQLPICSGQRHRTQQGVQLGLREGTIRNTSDEFKHK